MKYLKILLVSLMFSFSLLHADVISVNIAASSDDADQSQRTSIFGNINNSTNVTANSLNFGYIASTNFFWSNSQHQIGLRFLPIIPVGSTINSATIQFTSASIHTNPTTLSIDGELNTNALTFTTANTDISSRTLTGTPISWSVNPWGLNERGPDEVTPDLTNIIQALINQPGWQSGNGMVFVLSPGVGCVNTQCYREAVSFDGDSTNAATLTVDFTPPPIPPVMGTVPNQTVDINDNFALDISDYVTETNGDPILGYTLTGTLPVGLDFNATSGVISGIPTALGTSNLSVIATDIDGNSNPSAFTITVVLNSLIVNYRMDECYWFNGVSGIVDDVKDSSINKLDATSYPAALIDTPISTPPLCNVGTFDGTDSYLDVPDDPLLDTTNTYTISAWINPSNFTQNFELLAHKTTDYGDGFSFYINWDTASTDSTVATLILLTGSSTANRNLVTSPINANIWTYFVVSYDGNTLRLYKNGLEVATTAYTATIANANTPLILGKGLGNQYYYAGQMDEFKLWNRALSATEVSNIYANEFAEKNYNGTPRVCNTCEANIGTNSWELIGIPAESRTTVVGVQDVFGDDFIGANYNAGAIGGWVLWKRSYNLNNNNASYVKVDYVANELITFGEAYWLGSTVDTNWSVNDLVPVDYDSVNCASFTNKRCVEIPLHVVSSDGTDGSGIYRYNMTGFIGKQPIEWANCRFDIDGIIYSPTAAHNAGLINKTIWQYGGGAGTGTGGQVLSTDYTSCDDTTPGGCKLLPYHGFWVELNSTTLGKNIKLLIPEE